MICKGLNLVAQIVKSQGGTVHVRSSRGVGTTVKVSVPLRHPITTSAAVATTALANISSSNASVGFHGFGALVTDPTAKLLKSKANTKLLNSLKLGCKQLGLTICASDDTLDHAVDIFIVQMEALERLTKSDDQGPQHSLLSSSGLRRHLIIICPTRDSALKFLSSPMGKSFPSTAQCIWLPVGPGKLAGAISSSCMYYKPAAVEFHITEPGIADISSVETRIDDGYATAVLDTVKSPVTARVAANAAHILPDIVDCRSLVDARNIDASTSIKPTSPEAVREDKVSHLSQTLLPKRSGSDTATRPSTLSAQLLTQMNRSATAPYGGAGALSLLLVDDNVRIS